MAIQLGRAAKWIVVAATMVACTGQVGELRAVAHNADFTLVITSQRDTWATSDAIEIDAALTYNGGHADVALTGSGSGVLLFSVEELNGDRRMDAAMHLDCRGYSIGPRAPITSPYRKSGGFTDEDPNAAFYMAFFADPVFRLPAGAWKVTALASFGVGPECGGGRPVMLEAPLTINVR